jgi:competence protein ComEA
MKSMRSRGGELAHRLAEIWRKAAAWRWGSPIVRAAAAVLGLVVLAAIGRSALARGTGKSQAVTVDPPVADSPQDTHAGEAVTAPIATPLPVPPTAPASSPAIAATADAGDGKPRNRATPDDPVFLNQATVADLRRLPGVGAKRAQAILALRDRIQHFRQIEDLLKVKGIGRASLRKLRPLVRLDLPPAPPDAGATPPPPSPG